MKLREREYHSQFDRRNKRERRIVPEYERPPIDFRRVMFKYGPYVVAAAVGYWALSTFVF